MINIIYGLRDPRNDIYYYIGKSTVGDKRALQHLKKSHSSQVNEWIEEVRGEGVEPLVDIIGEVRDINYLSASERYWVDYYHKINPELLNKQLIPSNINLVRTEDDIKKFNYICEIISELPKILKKERKLRKLNQEEMAEIAGISLGTLKNLEGGKQHVGFCNFLKYLIALQ